MDSWKVTDAQEAMPAGSLRQEGGRILLTVDDGSGEYIIEDAPSGLPLNTALNSYLAVHGFLKDGQLHWDNIQYFPVGSGGPVTSALRIAVSYLFTFSVVIGSLPK